MSAYLVEPKHIATLSQWMKQQGFDRKNVATPLAEENIKSIGYRYPYSKGNEAHEWLSMKDNQHYIDECVNMNVGRQVIRISGGMVEEWLVDIKPLSIIKMAKVLDYQSCEHPDYKTSEARDIIDRIIDTAIPKLEGYQTAWV
jgi:hypothetical protein